MEHRAAVPLRGVRRTASADPIGLSLPRPGLNMPPIAAIVARGCLSRFHNGADVQTCAQSLRTTIAPGQVNVTYRDAGRLLMRCCDGESRDTVDICRRLTPVALAQILLPRHAPCTGVSLGRVDRFCPIGTPCTGGLCRRCGQMSVHGRVRRVAPRPGRHLPACN